MSGEFRFGAATPVGDAAGDVRFVVRGGWRMSRNHFYPLRDGPASSASLRLACTA